MLLTVLVRNINHLLKLLSIFIKPQKLSGHLDFKHHFFCHLTLNQAVYASIPFLTSFS